MVYTVKDINWKIWENVNSLYTGEVDLSDNPCGFGTLVFKNNKREGTWLNGKEHGLSMLLCMHNGA